MARPSNRTMKRLVTLAFVFALVASLVIAVGVASAAAPTVQHLVLSNQLDPNASAAYTAACGVPVEDRDTGRITLITYYDKAGNPTRSATLQSITSTYSNPETGASVTIKGAVQVTESLVVTDANGSFTYTATFRGLNFVYKQPDGKLVSAGRGMLLLTVVFDAAGNVVSETFTDLATPKLTHSTDLICPALGGTAP
jgi:hypothetical protein